MEGIVLSSSLVLKAVVIGALTYLGLKVTGALLRYRKFRKIFNDCPGQNDFSFIYGNLHKFPGPNEEGIKYDFEMMRTICPKFQRVWAGPVTPVLLLHHPDTVKVLLKSSEPKPRGRFLSGPYDMGIPWLGEGLLIANGAKWARNRRLLTPAFHFDILRPYMTVNNQAVDIVLDKLAKTSESQKSFEVFSITSLLALDVILRCAFSYHSDCQVTGEGHPYVQAVNSLIVLWSERSLNPLLYMDFIYFLTPSGRKFQKMCNYVHGVAEEIIEKRRKNIEENGLPSKTSSKGRKRVLDFLDILLTARDENGEGLTPLEIRNEVDTFLFEGHDTTTSGMSWILYNMAKHPEYQTRVQEEIDGILKGRETDYIEWDDLPKLEYLSLCIKESLRLHPPVPFIERELTKETEIDGHMIPTGTFIGIQINNLCHNPHVWDQPYDYIPERWLDPDVKIKDPFAYTPFSAGPRNCIGQNFAMHEMKVVVARILHRFTLTLEPDHEVRKALFATMKTENGMKMYAAPRRQTA